MADYSTHAHASEHSQHRLWRRSAPAYGGIVLWTALPAVSLLWSSEHVAVVPLPGVDVNILQRTATYTARLFCGDRNTLTVRMHDVSFRMPVQVTDLVKIRGRVSFVRNTNLQVLIEVWVIKPDGQEVLSHDGTISCLGDLHSSLPSACCSSALPLCCYDSLSPQLCKNHSS